MVNLAQIHPYADNLCRCLVSFHRYQVFKVHLMDIFASQFNETLYREVSAVGIVNVYVRVTFKVRE